MRSLVLLTLLTVPVEQPAPPACTDAAECRQLVLAAVEQQDYEGAHDLAWRAMRTGPPNDPALMLLLARTQSLSGRPHDALVMLGRLADRGVAIHDAESSDDFRRVRTLPGWPALLEKITAPGALVAPTPAAPVTPSAAAKAAPTRPADATATKPAAPPAATPPASPPAAPPVATTTAEVASKTPRVDLAVPRGVSSPVALAYDSVSRRFVLADESSETLKIVDELSGNAVNLVSRNWAGRYRSAALAIDPQRGDLWVAGAQQDAEGISRSAIHRLQLVSGRTLYAITLPDEAGAARFTDVALANGHVFVLDAQGKRIFRLAIGTKSLDAVMAIDALGNPAGLAAAGETTAYVAHDKGLARVDLAAKRATDVRAANNVDLQGLHWLGWHNGSLVGIQKAADGKQTAVRIRLNRGGTTATAIEVIDVAASRAASVVGGVFYYLGFQPGSSETAVRSVDLR